MEIESALDKTMPQNRTNKTLDTVIISAKQFLADHGVFCALAGTWALASVADAYFTIEGISHHTGVEGNRFAQLFIDYLGVAKGIMTHKMLVGTSALACTIVMEKDKEDIMNPFYARMALGASALYQSGCAALWYLSVLALK